MNYNVFTLGTLSPYGNYRFVFDITIVLVIIGVIILGFYYVVITKFIIIKTNLFYQYKMTISVYKNEWIQKQVRRLCFVFQVFTNDFLRYI